MFKYLKLSVLILLIMFLLGCGGSKPSRYYLLTAESDTGPLTDLKKDIKIGLGPVRFPEYLKRPQILSFVGSQEVKLAEYSRWAEPLDENFSRVLAENLTRLVSTEQIEIYPFLKPEEIDYIISLEVRQFELSQPSEVSLTALWKIYETENQSLQVERRSEYRSAVNPEAYESITSGMSQILFDLSQEISESLNDMLQSR